MPRNVPSIERFEKRAMRGKIAGEEKAHEVSNPFLCRPVIYLELEEEGW
jgi:hypothetical protein